MTPGAPVSAFSSVLRLNGLRKLASLCYLPHNGNHNPKESHLMSKTEEIRNSITIHLGELRSEVARLEQALGALGSNGAGRTSSVTIASSTGASQIKTRSKVAKDATKPPLRTRGAKNTILDCLRASETPLTAGQVAASTGLGSRSISTTLSKLAKSGEAVKNDRGYSIA